MADFVGLLRRLGEARVDFVLVGGLAAAGHGCTLVTQDVDVCIRLGAENLGRLQTALRDLDPVHRMAATPLPFSHEMEVLALFHNVFLRTRLGQLDCLGEILGVGDYGAAVEKSIAIDLGGVTCRLLSLDVLIASKEAMTRDRDKAALEQLRRIKALRDAR